MISKITAKYQERIVPLTMIFNSKMFAAVKIIKRLEEAGESVN